MADVLPHDDGMRPIPFGPNKDDDVDGSDFAAVSFAGDEAKEATERASDKPAIEDMVMMRKSDLFLRWLSDNLERFPRTHRPHVEKVINGIELSRKEQLEYHNVRASVWHRVTGFPYDDGTQRDKLLNERYGPLSGEVVLDTDLKKQIARVMRKMWGNGNGEAIPHIDTFIERFLTDQEAVAVLESIQHIVHNERLLADRAQNAERHEDHSDIFRDLTECQYLLSHFILSSSYSRGDLAFFWRVAKELAADAGGAHEFKAHLRGALRQAAINNILEAIGKKPQLSTPSEDMYHAIDMWIQEDEESVALQVTGLSDTTAEPLFIASDSVAAPFSQSTTRGGQDQAFWASHNLGGTAQGDALERKTTRFFAKVTRYNERAPRPIKNAYMMVLPDSYYDEITGEPTTAAIEYFREQIETSELEGVMSALRVAF